MAKQFWVRTSKGVQGPFSGRQVKSFFEAGKLKATHEISPDQEHWQSLGKVMSLPSNAGTTPTPPRGEKPPGRSQEEDGADRREHRGL